MLSFLTRTVLAADSDIIADFDTINPLGKGTSLLTIIDRVFDWLLRFTALVVPIMILWGAFQMLTSAGNAEKFGSGKKTILYAVIGFAIVLMARGVVDILKSILVTTPS